MTQTQSDNNIIAIVSDRFQSIGPERRKLLEMAAEDAGEIFVLVRDADRPVSLLDPLTFEERELLIRSQLESFPYENEKLHVLPVPGLANDRKAREHFLSMISSEIVDRHQKLHGEKPQIFGYGLGSAEGLIPMGCDRIATETLGKEGMSWREKMLGLTPENALGSPEAREAILPDARARIDGEREARIATRERYGIGPHDTADAVCTHGDHVLLIKRANHPFKDKWALPGGIVDPDEVEGKLWREAACRELAEETLIRDDNGLAYTAEALSAMIMDEAEFGPEDRDPRGLYRAHAFHFRFNSLLPEPTVTGADDATEAMWAPLRDLSPSDLAFDHFDIIQKLVGIDYPGKGF